jgi:hypothetical protein
MLFTIHNTKLQKSEKFGYLTIGLHLAPYDLSGYNTCTHSTIACRISCLFRSSRGSLDKIQKSRIEKTKFLYEKQEEFLNQINAEIYYYKTIAKNKGLKLCIRPNLTSDIDFQSFHIDGKSLMEIHSDIQWYDYTKNYLRKSLFPNYDLTYSYDSVNHKKGLEVLNQGERLAVVFDSKEVKTFLSKEVVSGDLHDLTFLQPKDKILGLIYKNITTKGFNNNLNKKESTLVVNI